MSNVSRWLEAMNVIEDKRAAANSLKPGPWRATGTDATAEFMAPTGALYVHGDNYGPAILPPGDARCLARWILDELSDPETEGQP